MRRIQLIVLLACGMLCFAQPIFAATVLQLNPTEIQVKEGEKFQVRVQAIPNETNNYTVKVVTEFSPEYVSVYAWDYEDEWMPLRKAGYDGMDNDLGTLTRTAGYPNGFDTPTKFGTITFLTKKTGTTSINISQSSLVLDEQNKNVFVVGRPVQLVIQALPVPEPIKQPSEPPASSQATIQQPLSVSQPVRLDEPVQEVDSEPTELPLSIQVEEPLLLTSQLRLKASKVKDSADLVAVSVLDSSSEKPLEVTVEYRIFDQARKEIYKKTSAATVSGQEVAIVEFPDLTLSGGRYVLVANVFQNNLLLSEQEQPFEVEATVVATGIIDDGSSTDTLLLFLVFLFALIGALLVMGRFVHDGATEDQKRLIRQ